MRYERTLRVLSGAWLAYRGLFTWLNPLGYVSTRLLTPLFIGLLFCSLGGSQGADATRIALGTGLYAAFLGTLMGLALTTANERRFGTLSAWLGTPRLLAVSLAERSLAHVVDAFLSAVVTTSVTVALLGLDVTSGQFLRFLAALLPASAAGVALGLSAVAASIRFRDMFTVPNVWQAVILVTSGAVAGPELTPTWLGWAGRVLPLGNAVRTLDSGTNPIFALLVELLVDVAWGSAGYVTVVVLVRRARQVGSFALA